MTVMKPDNTLNNMIITSRMLGPMSVIESYVGRQVFATENVTIDESKNLLIIDIVKHICLQMYNKESRKSKKKTTTWGAKPPRLLFGVVGC